MPLITEIRTREAGPAAPAGPDSPDAEKINPDPFESDKQL